jgi:hypothetical protein
MCVRTDDTGVHYVVCAACQKREYGGSFSKLAFIEYLKAKLGWQAVKQSGQWVRLCPGCYQDAPAW